MKHPIRLALLVVALVLAGIGGSIAPASAHHEWVHPHWHSWEHPVVRTPTCYYWGNSTNYCNMVADAAYYWQARGFDKGFTPPLPVTGHYRCEPPWGSINICFVSLGDPLLQGKVGLTQSYSYEFNGDPNHASGVQIYVCGNCPLLEQKVTLRHELGHALGLGHTLTLGTTPANSCVMHDPPYTSENGACQEDIDHMRNMYQHTD